MALVIAGERSGVGKTTITLAILAYLCDRTSSNHRTVGCRTSTQPTPTPPLPHSPTPPLHSIIQSFKVGPDYIDPMFHGYVTRRPCRNLDPILTSETYVQQCFASHSQGADYSVVEGVMGLFDGACGTDDTASTAHVARLLNLPIVLVLDCSRLSRSVAAIIHGYSTFDPRLHIAGVILNRVGSDRHRHLLESAIAPLKIPILGVLHRHPNITVPDRHLGLVPTDELPALNQVIAELRAIAATRFNWELLLPLLKSRGEFHTPSSPVQPTARTPALEPAVRIAIARDRAFNFYYPDNLDLLEQLGATLVYWSPLSDTRLPANIQGLYLGGGFPEVFGPELTQNKPARSSVKTAIEAGLPTYAECGGLMYLCEAIVDFEGIRHPMVGVLPTTVRMGKRLVLGYRHAIAQYSTPLIERSQTIWGHEFHHSHLETTNPNPLYELQGYDPQQHHRWEGWHRFNLHASYLHTHWGAQPELPQRFLLHCQQIGFRI